MTTLPHQPGRRLTGLPFVVVIRLYQRLVSPWLGTNCRFTPTCSAYAVRSLERFGLVRGGWLAVRRLGKCQPFGPSGFDPVPASWEER